MPEPNRNRRPPGPARATAPPPRTHGRQFADVNVPNLFKGRWPFRWEYPVRCLLEKERIPCCSETRPYGTDQSTTTQDRKTQTAMGMAGPHSLGRRTELRGLGLSAAVSRKM